MVKSDNHSKPQIHHTTAESPGEADLIQLRFTSHDKTLTMLNAVQLADCLEGLSELTGIMSRQGSFDSPTAPEVMIRPLREGSFLVEALLFVQENGLNLGALGAGTSFVMKQAPILVDSITTLLKQTRTRVQSYERLDNGFVSVTWQDGSTDEVTEAIWRELQTKKKRSKNALGKILSALGGEADALEIRLGNTDQTSEAIEATAPVATIGTQNYKDVLAVPDDIENEFEFFDSEGQLDTIEFNRPDKWKIIARGERRVATIEDKDFLQSVNQGRALRKDDIFNFRIREDRTIKNDRTTKTWAVVEVTGHRRGAHDESATEAEGTDSPQ